MNIDKSIRQLQESLDNIADAIVNQNKIRAFEIKGIVGNLGILREYLCRTAEQGEPKPLPTTKVKTSPPATPKGEICLTCGHMVLPHWKYCQECGSYLLHDGGKLLLT